VIILPCLTLLRGLFLLPCLSIVHDWFFKALTHKTLLIPIAFVVINRFTHDNLQNISDINNLRRALYYIAMKQQKIVSKLFICTKLRSVQYSKITRSNLREFTTINIILLINK